MTTKKAALGSRWASVTDVMQRAQKARENRDGQRKLIGSLQDQVERKREELARSLSDLPPAQRKSLIDQAVASFTNDLRRNTMSARVAFIREADAHRAASEAVAQHYQSPIQMLMRHNLGTERRSRILEQIAQSGPVELASLAELAASTKDLELAAALCSRNASIKPGERSFSAQELADVLMGDDYRRVRASLMEMDRLNIEVGDDDRAFQTGRQGSSNAITVALMKRAETEIGAKPINPEGEAE